MGMALPSLPVQKFPQALWEWLFPQSLLKEPAIHNPASNMKKPKSWNRSWYCKIKSFSLGIGLQILVSSISANLCFAGFYKYFAPKKLDLKTFIINLN
jgi:hypothetical protein